VRLAGRRWQLAGAFAAVLAGWYFESAFRGHWAMRNRRVAHGRSMRNKTPACKGREPNHGVIMQRNWPVSVSDDDLRRAVARWSELLAEKRFAEALAMFGVWEDEYADEWTPELLETTIANYGCSEPDPEGRVFAVTSLYELPGVNVDEYIARHIELDRQNLYGLDASRYLGMIHFDGVPLNGDPSDLTARFNIRKVGEDRLTLEFVDILVM
jgi:hypothetical protein